ncbi:MAG: hypothetical protein ABI333_03335 [bacterium]
MTLAVAVATAAVTAAATAAGCNARTVGGSANDGAPPDQDSGAADGAVVQEKAWLAFLRGQDSPEPSGLWAVRDDGLETVYLSGGLDPGGVVEAFAMSHAGGVFREATDASGARELRYHLIRRDGTPIVVTPFESWELRVPDLGLMDRGRTAWALSRTELRVVDLAAETQTPHAVRTVLLATEGGRWVITSEPTSTQIVVGALDLETGRRQDLHTFSSQQQPYRFAFDPVSEVAYAGVGLADVWALPLSGDGAFSVGDRWGVSGQLLGRIAETDELLIADAQEILALHPGTGAIRFRVQLGGVEESHGVSSDGAYYASVRFDAAGAATLEILTTRTGALATLSIAEHHSEPWSCCCGGPRAGTPVFHSAIGLAAIPIQYDFGMCACACDAEPVPPEQAELKVLVVDLVGGQVLWTVPHNGNCAPRFSPSGDRLALCDNDLHIIPLAGGYLNSAIAVHDLNSRNTVWLTDQDQNDSAVEWIH